MTLDEQLEAAAKFDELGTALNSVHPRHHLDEQLEAAVSAAIDMDDPVVSADIACEQALNALDHLMVLANQDNTWPAVAANKIFIGQILTRAQLVASFLMAKQVVDLRIVR